VITDKCTFTDVISIVLTAGYEPVNFLAGELEKAGIEHFVAGDSEQVAKIPQAASSVFEVAYKL
jgi:hypothetical protein